MIRALQSGMAGLALRMISYSAMNGQRGIFRKAKVMAVLLAAGTLAGGCSIKRTAVNAIANSLSEGPSTFEMDNDVELVGDALPFALKLFEVLLDESPRHPGLLLTTCKAFTMYAYAYIQQEAERVVDTDLSSSTMLRDRAGRMYERARAYGLRALKETVPGAVKDGALVLEGLKGARAKDVPVLYWNAASLGLAISISRDNPEMIARIPEVRALLDRALALDESWDGGNLLELDLILAGSQLSLSEEEMDRLGKLYEKVVTLSQGKRASVHVSYAEAVAVRRQDRKAFTEALGKALAISADQDPQTRLANLISQRRARWLLDRIDELILAPEEETQ